MFISGVPVWPQHNCAKYILLTWVLVTLILDFGKSCYVIYDNIHVLCKHIFSAYSGCLVASLTLPKRPPFINTFQELLNQKDITIVGSQNSFMDYLNQTSDSVLMVLLLTILISKQLTFNVSRSWITECCSKATMKLTYLSPNTKHLHTKFYIAQPQLSACRS